MKPNSEPPAPRRRVAEGADTAPNGNNLQPPHTLRALWELVCLRAPAVVISPGTQLGARFDGHRAGKYLMIHEDDLVQLGGHIEGLSQVGAVSQRGSWPRGDLNEAGRVLPHGTPLYATKREGP